MTFSVVNEVGTRHASAKDQRNGAHGGVTNEFDLHELPFTVDPAVSI
jgi:hypothetical protein